MRITFVSLDAYPLLDPDAPGGIGGAEVRATTFARGLQRLDKYDIDFVISDRPGLRDEASGFRLHAYQKNRGTGRAIEKLTHSITTRFTGRPQPDQFFRAIETDAVLCFGVRNDTASIIRSAHEKGKRTVLFLTSDRNLEDALRRGRRDRGIYGELGHLCRYALTMADRVVVQSPFQLNELWRTLRIEGRLIRNPIELGGHQDTKPNRREPPIALWIGRADTFSKRADLCVELAKACPRIQFKMVMNNHHDETFELIRRSAPSNVEIIERVPFAEIENHFRAATLLVNTSAAEGFPNSFLQAGKFGKPVVSLKVDPANMLGKSGCGVCAQGDLMVMAKVVDHLCLNTSAYRNLSQAIRRYVCQHHDAAKQCDQLDELLTDLFAARRNTAA